MPISNFDIVLMVLDAVAAHERADVERKFRDDYRNAQSTRSAYYAETLAASTAEYWLLRVEMHEDGRAYLRSHIK